MRSSREWARRSRDPGALAGRWSYGVLVPSERARRAPAGPSRRTAAAAAHRGAAARHDGGAAPWTTGASLGGRRTAVARLHPGACELQPPLRALATAAAPRPDARAVRR